MTRYSSMKIFVVLVCIIFISVPVFAGQETKSAYDDIPEFGGPGSVGVELKDDNKLVEKGDFIRDNLPGWFETKGEVMQNYGFAYGINYSTLYQKASDAIDEDNAWGGIFQLPLSWTVMGDKQKGTSGTVVFKLENRHKIATDITPQDLGIQGIGAASITGTLFSDKDWMLTNLYWQHKMNNGRFSYVIGQIDNTDFLDVYGLINPQSAFMNLNFSTNPSIGLPDQGFGAYAGVAFSENFYIVGGLMDARGDPTKPGDSLNDFFDKNQYFSHIEIGYTTSFERRYFDNVHFLYWNSDTQTNAQGIKTEVAGSGWAFSAAHFFDDKYMPFFRYGESDGGGGALNERSLSVGLGIYQADSGNLFAVGLSASDPSPLTFASGLERQYTGEIFYRFQLSKHLAITPDLQYIKDPALNPNQNSVIIAGIRLRASI